MIGYLAFPPTSDGGFVRPPSHRVPLSAIQESQPDASNANTADKMDVDDMKKAQEEEWARKRVAQEEVHRQRLEAEQREIWLNELAWVRSGGILRDEHYRPDKVRTEMARAENRLQDEERAIQEEWDKYEARCRALSTIAATMERVSWQDVPWPVHGQPASPDDITPQAVAKFLFSTYEIRGSTRNEKERIRSSFLRWHPDKFPQAVQAKIPEEERAMIMDGISSVFMSLKHIQEVERKPS